ncbi:hypothetical protein [Lentzea sp. CC55]|uniref:hypothetical protein n=1 Tax=Lentzea sp. CC55 TaxID=2884909 RepID=UPI001F45B9A7|nr:hypothetical protein [Lentzea sp. CC55]MCG8926664.1 hypothetical protein [Lentzea sp. CC55]
MPRSKIQDEGEVVRWMEEGKPYSWMVEEYKRKYNVETSISMWSNFRRRHDFEGRMARDPELVPWKVKEEHSWATPLTMLRLEARRRQGFPLRPQDETRLINWLDAVKLQQAVVHYDPDTEEGFFYVPREERDDDLIRRPLDG